VLAGGADDLRDHVARALDDHEIALADVLAADVVLVVERGARHRHAPHVHGLELGERVEDTRASHADVDLHEPRHGRRGRPLERAGEARSAVQRAQPALLIERIDLDHDAVDLVAEARAPRLPLDTGFRDLVDRLDPLRARVGAEAALAQPLECLPLRRELVALEDADAVDEDRERALGGHGRVQLTQRACSRVASVRRRFAAGCDLRLVEPVEALEREEDLAADLDPSRRPVSAHPERDRGDRPEIHGHVLPALAVTSRRAARQDAVLVDEGNGRPVDLRLEHVRDGLVGAKALPDVVGPLLERLAGRDLLERAHRREVRHLREPLGRRRADALGR
jgi:hypothetical protein